MICIKRKDCEDGRFFWFAEDTGRVIGEIELKSGQIPEITKLIFEQPEIGDGLIKTAAAFFAAAGVSVLRFSPETQKNQEAALGAGFVQTVNGFELNPADVKRGCKGR